MNSGATGGSAASRRAAGRRPGGSGDGKQALLKLASTQPRRAGHGLTVKCGVVSGGGKSVTYGELIGEKLFNIDDQTRGR